MSPYTAPLRANGAATVDDLAELAGHVDVSGLRRTKSGTQALTLNTPTVLTWDTTDWALGTGVTAGTNSLVCAAAGLYLVEVTAAPTGSGDPVELQLLVGASVARSWGAAHSWSHDPGVHLVMLGAGAVLTTRATALTGDNTIDSGAANSGFSALLLRGT